MVNLEQTLTDFTSGTLNVGMIFIVFAVIIIIMGIGFYFYFQTQRYKQFLCIIWYRDGFGQLQQTFDNAGVFIDGKTNNKRLFLQKADVGLCPDEIPFLTGNKGKRYVYLYRKGLKNFFFLRPEINMDGVKIQVGEEDVNWSVNSYEKAKKLFSATTLLQYMPFIALAFVSIIILIIFIYFFKDFDVLKEVALALAEASKNMANAGTGTAVIPA